jgi:ribosomal protein S18 acetylase RimI-like enzyme
MQINTFIPVNTDGLTAIQILAGEIWREYYPAIIGEEQTEYMLHRFYSPEALASQMESGHRFYAAVTENGDPVGYASVSVDTEHQAFLHKFYLSAVARSRGNAAEFWNFLKSELVQMNASVVRLTVNRQNIKAINFYFRNGFVIEKAADFDIGGGWFMNDFVMRCSL